MVEATLQIFQRLATEVPPLVPEQLRSDVKESYEQASGNVHLEIEELEDIVVSFGKKLWPYREAFLEMYRLSESTVGEKFFEAKLYPELRTPYNQYLDRGHSFTSLYLGRDMEEFTAEQRQELCELMVALKHELWDYTVQRVLGVDKEKYQEKIAEFTDVQRTIQKELDKLHQMAEAEEDHPELAMEMKEHIRGFEHGMALLGPKLDHSAVCEVVPHFEGRRKERTFRKLCRPPRQ